MQEMGNGESSRGQTYQIQKTDFTKLKIRIRSKAERLQRFPVESFGEKFSG